MTVGRIHSVESMGLVDGPGIRTVLFFQGCDLRCKYCHNPDTWQKNGAKEMTVAEVMKMLKRYRPYYGTNGGVTCSGGEALLQLDFLTELFQACKQEGISTCLDTAGYAEGPFDQLLEVTDLVLFDVKHFEKNAYRTLCGGDISVPTRFLNEVQKHNVPLWIRHVVVPGITDSIEHIQWLGRYLRGISGVEKIELLPYHTLGVGKYDTMGIPYAFKGIPPMDKSKLEKLQECLEKIVSETERKD